MPVKMIICCLPIAAVVLLPLVGVQLGRGMRTLFFLACPLTHLVMMRAMHGNSTKFGGSDAHTENRTDPNVLSHAGRRAGKKASGVSSISESANETSAG